MALEWSLSEITALVRRLQDAGVLARTEQVNGSDMVVARASGGQVVAFHVFGDNVGRPYCWLLFRTREDFDSGHESYDYGFVDLDGAVSLVEGL